MTSASNKKALAIQKGIRQAEDDLVTYIQEALDKKESYGDLKSSQFRNLVQVSYNTESAEVIKNFLRYQVGRDTRKWGRGEGSLSETIISDIDSKIKEKAKAIKEIAEAEDHKSIWVQLIRLYLGYGARHLMYLRPEK